MDPSWVRDVPRKVYRPLKLSYPYRKPTQVVGHEYAKVYERTLVKELGKKVGVTSG